MNIQDFRAKLELAKQVQSATNQNPNLRDYVGQMMNVKGMHITEGIEIKSAGLIVDKVTFLLTDGTAIDGFHMAAVEKAEELIEVLGEGPYPIPLLMEVCQTETKRGWKQFAKLIDFAADPSEVAFKELEEDIDQPEETPTEIPEPQQPEQPDELEEQLAEQQPSRRSRKARK